MNISQIFNMGAYGVYVWPAYGITLLIFGINLFNTFKEKRQIRKLILQYLTHTKSNLVNNHES